MLKFDKSIGAAARTAFVLCLAALYCCSCGSAADCPDSGAASLGLCTEFQRLRDVIPAETLVYITAKHYQHDAKFRHAMRFLQTAEFAAATAQIEKSTVYRALLQEFVNEGVNITDIATIGGVLKCILLPMPEAGAGARGGAAAVAASRSLQSYAQELMNAMPHNKFQELLSSEMASNEQLVKFYRIIRSPSFQQRALQALASRLIRRPICVLRRNYIDLRKLITYVFQIFSWGPTEY